MSKRAALILVTSSFPAGEPSGQEAAGAFVWDLAVKLSAEVPVRVVAPGGRAAREVLGDNLQIHRYAAPSRALSTLKPWRLSDLFWIFRVLLGGQRALRRAIAQGPLLHVVALWAFPCGFWAWRTAVVGAGYSVWTLGSDIWGLARLPGLRGLIGSTLVHADKVWADGKALARESSELAGREVEFLPSARALPDINCPKRVWQSDKVTISFVGRWHPNKGIDLFLDALRRLPDTAWDVIDRVCIAGGGPMEAYVESAVRQLRHQQHRIDLNGYLGPEDFVRMLRETDYLVIPSRVESIPLIYSDAARIGCPVVVTPVGDLAALMRTQPTGILAAGVTAQAIADAIVQAVSTDPQVFSSAMQSVARQFSLDHAASVLLQSADRGARDLSHSDMA